MKYERPAMQPLRREERKALLVLLGLLGEQATGLHPKTVLRAAAGFALQSPAREQLRRFLFQHFNITSAISDAADDILP